MLLAFNFLPTWSSVQAKSNISGDRSEWRKKKKGKIDYKTEQEQLLINLEQ